MPAMPTGVKRTHADRLVHDGFFAYSIVTIRRCGHGERHAGPEKRRRAMATRIQPDGSFRFFDNRETYRLFVFTCNGKQIIANPIALDIQYLMPQPLAPASSTPAWGMRRS